MNEVINKYEDLKRVVRGEIVSDKIVLAGGLRDDESVKRVEEKLWKRVRELGVVNNTFSIFHNLLVSDGFNSGRVVLGPQESEVKSDSKGRPLNLVIPYDNIERMSVHAVRGETFRLPTYRWGLKWHQPDRNAIPRLVRMEAYLFPNDDLMVRGVSAITVSSRKEELVERLLLEKFIELNELPYLGVPEVTE